MLFATGFRAPDAFACLEWDGRRAILLNDLEIDRGRRDARVDEVVSFSELEGRLRGKKKKPVPPAKVFAAFLRERGVKRTEVPADFPLGLARALRKEGVRVRPAKGPLFPERAIKSREQARHIAAACRVAEAGMARAIEVLAASKPRRDGVLIWSRRVLTAEALRAEIEIAIVRAGGEARQDSIVACGELACDPHERGHGPLLANRLIILDIFPRTASTGFYGDITRTVVRGKATPDQARLWQTCLDAQKAALAAMVPGAEGLALQNHTRAFFAEAGFPTEISDGRWRGFFHGLGHGLGLEVHESPRLAAATLVPGQVFTVEPGLYWPGVGGVRHEDVVQLTATGCRPLTKFPKPFEI